MGWSYTGATCFDKRGNVDRREEMRKALFGCTIFKDRMVGSTYYAAIKDKNEGVFILIALTNVDKGDFGYKDMDASAGPYVYTCPESILKLNTHHDGYTDEWIDNCRSTHAKREKLKRAKRISVKMPFDTNHFSEGTTLYLYKQGKRWYASGTYLYFTAQLMTRLLDKDAIEVIE